MRIISVKRLKNFWLNRKHKDSEQSLKAWYHEARKSRWKSHNDIKDKYRSASILKDDRAVFNIKGNKYRLVVMVSYKYQVVFIRFIGTHEEYNKINAEKI
jgi:mRNA interferase HigB